MATKKYKKVVKKTPTKKAAKKKPAVKAKTVAKKVVKPVAKKKVAVKAKPAAKKKPTVKSKTSAKKITKKPKATAKTAIQKKPAVKAKTVAKKVVKPVAKKKVAVKAKPVAKKRPKKLITIADLSDAQIESCFDGSSNVDLVRNLFEDNYHPDLKIVDEEAFGAAFSEAIQSFIGVDETEEPEEWKEAYANNQEWGEIMAQNVNELLKELNS
jgi:hypothetical protein